MLKLAAVRQRIDAVKAFRARSTKGPTRDMSAFPTLFTEDRHVDTKYLAFPEVSSESRTYIPIGFVARDVIASNKLYTLRSATRFHFGVLTSAMHMAWVRVVSGRLESRIQYSTGIVYNNYPWPESPTNNQTQAVESAAQGVLDARAEFTGYSLAVLYDSLALQPALLKAHQKLDAAVDAAYGKKGFKSDAERVAFLFTLYQKYTSLLPVEQAAKKRKSKKTLA